MNTVDGNLNLLVVDVHDVLHSHLHTVLFSRHDDLVLVDRWRWHVDLGARAAHQLLHVLVVWAADEGMVAPFDVESFERQLGLLIRDQLDLVTCQLDAFFRARDADDVRVLRGTRNAYLRRRLQLELAKLDAFRSDDELVVFARDAYPETRT